VHPARPFFDAGLRQDVREQVGEVEIRGFDGDLQPAPERAARESTRAGTRIV
jgi:hypothetical protein